MRYDVDCGSCRASLVVVTLEPAETVEAGSDPVRTEDALVTIYCPSCGSRFTLAVPPGVEDVEVRLRG